MGKRSLFAGTLLLALMLSAWGNVLAAAFCPHMQQDHACCHAQVAQDHAAHEITGGMQMTPDVESAQGAEVTVSDKPIEGCDHCMSRASQSPLTVTLREADRTKPGSKYAVPVVASGSCDLALPFTAHVPSREHSPPEASVQRHVLISVFRI